MRVNKFDSKLVRIEILCFASNKLLFLIKNSLSFQDSFSFYFNESKKIHPRVYYKENISLHSESKMINFYP